MKNPPPHKPTYTDRTADKAPDINVDFGVERAKRQKKLRWRTHFSAAFFILVGAVATIVAISATAFFAATVPIEKQKSFDAKLFSTREPVYLSHPNGGIVKDLKVQLGDVVHEGQEILVFEFSDTYEEYSKTREAVATLLLKARCLASKKDGKIRLDLSQEFQAISIWLGQEEMSRELVKKCNRELLRNSLLLQKDQDEIAALKDQVGILKQLSKFEQSVWSKHRTDAENELRRKSIVKTLENAVNLSKAELHLKNYIHEKELRDLSQKDTLENQLFLITRELSQEKEHLNDLTQAVKNSVVFASISGRVQSLTVQHAGNRVSANEQIVSLSPLQVDLEITAEVPLAVIPQFKVGSQVELVGTEKYPFIKKSFPRVKKISRTSSGRGLIAISLTLPDNIALNNTAILEMLTDPTQGIEVVVQSKPTSIGQSIFEILSEFNIREEAKQQDI